MKKIIAIVVIVVAIVIAPYFTGKVIKQRFEYDIARINTKLEPLTHQKETIKLEYDAGWFSSTAKTTIDKVVINHRITHGPYCTFGIAKIDSKFELSQKANEKISKLFDGKEPYTITTAVGFTGTTQFTVTSPGIGQKTLPDSPNVTITWNGLNYSATISKERVDSSFDLPKLVINEKNSAEFSIENIKNKSSADRLLDQDFNLNLPEKLNVNGSGSIDKITFKSFNKQDNADLQINKITGQVASTKDNTYASNFGIDDIKFASNNGSFSTGKIDFNSVAKDPFWVLRSDLVAADWSTQSTFSANSVSVITSQAPIKALLDFNYKQQLTDNKTTIDFSELYNATNINLQVPNYQNLANTAELGYSINGLPKKELGDILKGYIDLFKLALTARSSNAHDTYINAMQEMRNNGERFVVATLQNTPSLTITAKTTGDKGNASANFKAALVKPDNNTNAQMLIMQAQSRLGSSLTINLAESLIDATALTANIPPEVLNAFKQDLVNRLHFINNKGEYSLMAEFKDGMFYVNGQPTPDFLQQYSQFFR